MYYCTLLCIAAVGVHTVHVYSTLPLYYTILCTHVLYRSKPGQSISIPYGYPTTAGFVSSLPIDQSLRSYPFLMSAGQYVTQMPYTQQQVLVHNVTCFALLNNIACNVIRVYTKCELTYWCSCT